MSRPRRLGLRGPEWHRAMADRLCSGLDAAEKKYGGKWGQDPQKDRAVNEKITDTARGVVEHATGKHVPEKMSN